MKNRRNKQTMKFEITRTRQITPKNKPCAGAKLEGSLKDPRYSALGTSPWRIEISTLDELIKLIEETKNPLILDKPTILAEDCAGIIEIYDGYRE